MTKEQLAQIRELESKATPAPWKKIDVKGFPTIELGNPKISRPFFDLCDDDNPEFIAAIRNATPALLDHIEKLEKEKEERNKWVKVQAEVVLRLEKRNQIMREALEKYKGIATTSNSLDLSDGLQLVTSDSSFIADEALKKEKDVV